MWLARHPRLFVFLVVAYFAAGKVGLSFAALNASASAVWPPTGIALAACLILGARAWPAVLAGAFLVNVTTTGNLFSSAVIAGGNTLEAVAGLWLAERYARGVACFDRAGDVFRFAGAAALATTIGATIGTLALRAGGQAAAGEAGAIWLTWWLGDLAGALVVTPAIVAWYRKPALELSSGRVAEAAATTTLVLAIGVACFAVPAISRYPIAFLCLPPLAWLALRFGLREVATAIAALAAIAVATTHSGLGPFALAGRHESLLVLQGFMATIALMMLPLAALAEEVGRALIAREAAMREERRARAQAESATRAQEEFLAMLSHELRSPLQAIGNSTQLLALRREAGTVDERSLGVIRRQTENLTRMVNDLLDVARAVAGKVSMVREAVDLEPVVRQCLEAMSAAGRLDHVSTEVRIEPMHVHADATRLEQMLANLLGNAAKFTPKGGRVALIAVRDGAQAVIRVEDDGIGIPAELLPRIFDLFTQGRQRNPDRREGGLGIGLAMVRRLAELHGGRIEASSEGAGRGSRFVLTLPLARTAPRDGRRVVVVEAVDARGSIRELLESDGHRVFHARDAASGVEAALRVRPEAVVVDLAAEGALAAPQALRARGAEIGAAPCLIAIGGYDDKFAERALAAGFDEHLPRPLDRDSLRRALDLSPAIAD